MVENMMYDTVFGLAENNYVLDWPYLTNTDDPYEETWAQATLVPAAGSANVPGPLPAVGLAVAFGFSRQLRKRIKASASNPPSASAEA
jgi:hypothetical protein